MKKFASSLLFLFPVVTFAQGFNPNGIIGTLASVSLVMGKVVPIFVGIAVLVFLYGVLKFVISGSESQDKRKEARSFMIWGIVAIFVMVSVWGLVGILQSASGLNGSVAPANLPTVIPQI